jgi:hypothetical protein
MGSESLLSHLTEKKRLKSQQVVTMNVRLNSVKTRRFKPWGKSMGSESIDSFSERRKIK